MNVRFLPEAAIDVRDIRQYLADRSPPTARRFQEAIEKTATFLGQMPGAGTLIDPRVSGLIRCDVREWQSSDDTFCTM